MILANYEWYLCLMATCHNISTFPFPMNNISFMNDSSNTVTMWSVQWSQWRASSLPYVVSSHSLMFAYILWVFRLWHSCKYSFSSVLYLYQFSSFPTHLYRTYDIVCNIDKLHNFSLWGPPVVASGDHVTTRLCPGRGRAAPQLRTAACQPGIGLWSPSLLTDHHTANY